jgi:transposase
MIARFVEATKPDLRPLADEATQLLADLVARRRQIIEMIVAERNRERRTPVKRVKKSIARLIAALEKELAEIDAEIDASVRGSPAWREKEDLIASVPAWGRSPRAPSSPNFRSSARSTAKKSPASPGLPRSPVNPASGRAKP